MTAALDYGLLREVANGMWFVLGVVMVVFLATIAVRAPLYKLPEKPDWLDRMLTVRQQLCVSLAILIMGSTTRAGFIWIELHCRNIVGADCDWVEQYAGIYLAIATSSAIIGGVWVVRTLSPVSWRPWAWSGAGAFALGAPLFYYATGQWVAFLAPTGRVVVGTHDGWLVALSVLIACFASYVALDLGERARRTTGWVSHAWLVASAVALGGGIWSMHFVAMLAFSLPNIDVSYDLAMTLMSLVLPIAVASIGLFAVRDNSRPAALIASGVLVGCGIALMHYTGMAAMHMQADLSYNALFFAASIFVAIGASVVAMWLAFSFTAVGWRVVASVIQGLAISGMHYLAMVAAVFHVPGGRLDTGAAIPQVQLAILVSCTTMAILITGLMLSIRDRRRDM